MLENLREEIEEIDNARKAIVPTPLFYYNTLGWSLSFNLGNVVKLCRNTVRDRDKSIPTVIAILPLQSHFEHNVTVLNCGSSVSSHCLASASA